MMISQFWKTSLKILLASFIFVGFFQLEAKAQTNSGNSKQTSTNTSPQETQNNLSKLANARNKMFAQSLEQKIRSTLSQQLENESFLVRVQTKLNLDLLSKEISQKTGGKGSLFLKTLGSNIESKSFVKEYLEGMPNEAFQEFISQVNVQTTFDKRVGAETQKILVNTAKQAIEFETSRGDVWETLQADLGQNTVRKIQEKLEKTSQELAAAEEARTRAESTLNAKEGISKQIEIQKQQLEKAKFDAENAVKSAQSETDRAKEELKNAKLQIESLQNQINDDKTPLGKLRKQVKGFELLVTFGPIALVLVIALGGLALLYLSLQNKRSKSMMEGLSLLAGALQKSSMAAQVRQPAQAISSRNDDSRAQIAESRSSKELSDGGIEIARQEAELAWNLMQKTQHTMLFILKDWLATNEGTDKFLSFSDAIGFTNASALWEKFPRSEIESLSSRMGETPSKVQSYQLVTQVYRLVQSRNAGRPDFYSALPLTDLVSVTDEDFALALGELETQSISHNLILLTPERAARVMKLIPNIEPKEIVRSMASLSKMELSDAENHIDLLKQSLVSKKRQKNWDVSAHITSLYDNAGTDEKTLINEVVQENTELSSKMRSVLLTFDDVLVLEKSTLLDLISPFSALELAELTSSATEPQQAKISKLLSEKMLLSVRQEFERFKQKPALRKRAQINGQRLQTELIEQMKDMIAEGTIESPEVTPASSEEKGAA